MLLTKLKIGIDYHGVIDCHPDYFALFCKLAITNGHKIYIITGGPAKDVSVKLKEYNIPYSKIFAIVDFYMPKETIGLSAVNNYKISDELWNKAKGEYCQKEGIDIHIDDSQEYIKWFSTPYCLYNQKENRCQTLNGDIIDFSLPPSEALSAIEQII